MPPPQLMLGQDTVSNGFAANEHPAHAPIVAPGTDTFAEIDGSAKKREWGSR
jgi:hypothetical protein